MRSIHGPWLLYANHEDPYQVRKLCNKPEARSAQAMLDRTLNSKLRAVDDHFLRARD